MSNSLDSFLARFRSVYRLLEKPSVSSVDSLSMDMQESAHRAFYLKEPRYIARFASEDVISIRNSSILDPMRKEFLELANVHSSVLRLKKLTPKSDDDVLEISRIATESTPDSTTRLWYQKAFVKLTRQLFEQEAYSQLDSTSLPIVFLRSGKFVSQHGIGDKFDVSESRSLFVESKRLDQMNSVGLSSLHEVDIETTQHVILIDAGLVSGLSASALMATLHFLGLKNLKIDFFTVFASCYGIMNLHSVAKSLEYFLSTHANIITFDINDDLRAMWKLKNGFQKATGDVGDFLYPVLI